MALVKLYKAVTDAEDKSLTLYDTSHQFYRRLREKLISEVVAKPLLTLGDIGFTFGGLQGKNADHFKEDGNAMYVSYMDVFSSQIIEKNDFSRVIVSPGEAQNKVKTGDVFFTVSSETPHEVGMSSVLLTEDIGSDLYLNSFCVGFRPDTNKVVARFLAHYLRSSFFRKELRKLAQGITRYNISRKELMKCPINLPDIATQNFIAQKLDGAYDCLIDIKNRSCMNGKLKIRVISDSLKV